jgi:hypothetical protein
LHHIVIVSIPLALNIACLVFWGKQWRQSRKAGVGAMFAALVFLGIAQLLGNLVAVIYNLLHVPALAHLLQHAAVLTSAYWLRIFCLHLEHVPSRVDFGGDPLWILGGGTDSFGALGGVGVCVSV